MVRYQGSVWGATKGGLVRINPENTTYQTYTNVDGLMTNELYAVAVDAKGRLWVGGKGWLVNFTDPENPDAYIFTDRDGRLVEIYDIAVTPDGDSVWLADRLGATLFLASASHGDGLIIDTYTRLGDIDRETPARRIFLTSDSVWVGTARGLAGGSRDDIRLLKSFTGWASFLPTQLTSLPQDSITGLVTRNDTLIIGTVSGIFRFDQSVPEMVPIDLVGSPDPFIYNMSLVGDSILINGSRGSVFLTPVGFAYQPTAGMPIPNSTAGTVDQFGTYWNGGLIDGIFYRDDTQFFLHHLDVGGLLSNNCLGVTYAQGKIWGAFGGTGVGYFDGQRWTKVEGINSASNGIIAIATGPRDAVWACSFGLGVYRIFGDSVAHYYVDNSSLSGLSGAENFVVVSDVYATEDGVWFANPSGVDGEVSVVNPYNESQWQSYLFIGGVSAEVIESVTVGEGILLAASATSGIYSVIYNGTPFTTGDDYVSLITSATSGIGSNNVRHVRIDRFDSLWAGTNYGLSFQALGEVLFTNIVLPADFGPEVIAIDFDGQGSVYAGSSHGMVVRSIVDGTFELFTARNSQLVNDDIRHIYYNVQDDRVWVSTGGGISIVSPEVSSATQDLDEVLAYPNPYVIRFGDETVRFNYSGIASVHIYTVSGELVRELPYVGEWDGKNEHGENVASGMYIFTLIDQGGEVGRGKLMLIRR